MIIILDKFYEKLSQTSNVPVVIISISIMLLVGFLISRLTKLLKLPNVTAYIIAGILIGPYCLNLIPSSVINGMEFISDIALAFIAFSVGEFFRFPTLRKNGAKVIVITLFESLLASILVFILTFFILHLGLAFSIILSALASATAPASTMMTIRQTKAKGDFVDTLFSIVALDDVVSLVAYSIAVSVALASLGGGFSVSIVLLPIVWNIMMIAIGIGLGFLLKVLMSRHSTDNRLIVAIAFLFVVCGIGAVVNVSPLLGCMAMGTTYINISNDDKLFKQLNYFSPPILLLFFVKSGLSFRLDSLINVESSIGGTPLLLIGFLYFIVRIVGKYMGAFIGCALTRKDKKVRNYLGLALSPQAGVAIGLAAIGARILGGDLGGMLQTIILSSSILYELIGPALAKLSLYLSGSYGKKSTETEKPAEAPEASKEEKIAALKEKLLEIQKEISNKEYARSEDEEAFLEATEELEESAASEYNRKKFINKR